MKRGVFGFLGFRLLDGEEESKRREKIKKGEEGSRYPGHSAWHFK